MEPASSGPSARDRVRRFAERRAPRLSAALLYYLLMRRQARDLRRAGHDERRVEELVAAAPDGTVAGIDGYALTDPRMGIGSMAPVQVREELLGMLERVAALRPTRLCEIGASGGGTLYLLTRVAAPDAVIVSLDIEIPPHTRRARDRMARDDQRLISMEANSQVAATRDQVAAAVGGEPLDFLFIDGDHSYEGVRADFELYSGLVRPGGLIALHDIQPDAGSGGQISGDVPRFWSEISPRYRSEELIADPAQSGYGIGLIHP